GVTAWERGSVSSEEDLTTDGHRYTRIKTNSQKGRKETNAGAESLTENLGTEKWEETRISQICTNGPDAVGRFSIEQASEYAVKIGMKSGRLRLRVRVRRLSRKEIRPLLVMALVVFSIRSSLADWNDVPSGSMKPTILEGDRVFVNKLAYDLKVPFTTWHLAEWSNRQRGDVVVFYSPHDEARLVKRVVGVPGDTVELRNEQLVINGKPMEYGPLGVEVSGQLSEAEQQQSLFATEKLTG